MKFCITTDGWSDKNQNQLHNIMVCMPMPYFLGAERLPADSETAVVAKEQVKRFMSKIFEKFRKMVLILAVYANLETTSQNSRAFS